MPPSPPSVPTPVTRSTKPMFADVIVPRRLSRAFTYRIPSHLHDRLHVGSLVWVPFGPSTLKGLVVSLNHSPDTQQGSKKGFPREFKEILSVQEGLGGPESSQDVLTMAQFLSDYYLAPIGQCIKFLSPPEKAPRVSLRYRITEVGKEVLHTNRRLSSTNRLVLERLTTVAKGLTLDTLRRSVKGTTARQIQQFRKKGWVTEEIKKKKSVDPVNKNRPVESRDLGLEGSTVTRNLSSPAISLFRNTVAQALGEGSFIPMLVEASAEKRLGYLVDAIELALTHKRGVLIVTGEVHRACLIGDWVQKRWPGQMELLHGRVQSKVRAGVWERIQNGTARIVVGTRSTIFAPVKDLGLICLDAEEDTSLKDEQSPRFHARDVGWERARQSQAILLLGSSHPSLETVQAIQDFAGEAPVFREPLRPPAIICCPVRDIPYGALLGQAMKRTMTSTLESGGQVILYHNRKGFAPLLICRDCGLVPRCPSCQISFTYYRHSQSLACQVCGVSAPVPDQCTSCHAARLEPVGFGTEWLEEEVRRMFPYARVARLDRGPSSRTFPPEQIRQSMWKGEIDVLIGTQMVFQGPPLPLVDCVGVPYADAGLHFPDFRAAEWAYHALCHVVALSKSQQEGGKIILQTYASDHHTIQAVVKQDPQVFYQQELKLRSALCYPPFSTIISLRVSGRDANHVLKVAQEWGRRLQSSYESQHPRWARTIAKKAFATEADDLPDLTILGPVPSTQIKGTGSVSWQLLVKTLQPDQARQIVRETKERLESEKQCGGVQIDIDVDPIEMA